jgi:tripartite-type tricarboxylate transporter receptor subunit TctC
MADASRAQADYPTKPIRVIVPWPAGGNIDAVARVLTARLTAGLGQQLVIENRAGAGGMIGSEVVARAAPDGYTVLVDNMTSHATNPSLFGQLPFDTERDFTPVRMMVTIPHVLVAHPSLPAKTMKELIAFAKSRAGRLDYASYGSGTASHLAGEMLKIRTHIDIVHIPYKGGPAALNATVAGEVPLYFLGIAITVPYVNSGRLRALAVTTLARTQLMPGVPTMVEAAELPGYEVAPLVAMMAPAATPKEIVFRLSNEIAKVMQMQDVKDSFSAMGLEGAEDRSPSRFPAWYRAEVAKWTKVIRDVGIKAER